MTNSLAVKAQKKLVKNSGFTLIELTLVIIILGVMSAGIAGFITLTTQTYLNVSERDEVLANARFVVERLNREIRDAVPNSVRVKQGVFAGFDIQCVEFVPVVASTTYVSIPVAPDIATDEITVIPFVDINNNDYQCPVNCVESVVVYPLDSDDIYQNQFDGTGKVFGIETITQTTSSEWTVTLDRSLGVVFDDESPTERLYIVRAPVSYCVASNRLFRYENYGYSPVQLLPPIAPSVLMAENIVNMDFNEPAFTALGSTLQRNALLQMNLHFSRENEDYVFDHEIHILNIP